MPLDILAKRLLRLRTHIVSNNDVITGEAPARYAGALLDLAKESKSLKTVEKDVASLLALFTKQPALAAMANNPVYALDDKAAALIAVAKKAKLGKLMTQFVGTVAQNQRASELPQILSAFQNKVALDKGTQVAKITSAAKLTAADVTAIKAQLKKSLGKTVSVETKVDPDLIGGFVVQIGSRLYDHSLKTKLDDLRLELKNA